MKRFCVFVLLFSVLLLGSQRDAHACACCTSVGQRNVGVSRLDSYKVGEITKLQFATEATLFTGEADPRDVRGIEAPASRYALAVTWQENRLTFKFRDQTGKEGTLTLPRPTTVSVFEVDPRTQPVEGGSGPVLYKEWKLMGRPSGTGIFAPSLGAGQLLSLILQGRGNSCTTAADFTHWTLAMAGPKGSYAFFGDLVPMQ
jgi:hypothetical protein